MKLILVLTILLLSQSSSSQQSQEQQQQSAHCMFIGCRCDGDESSQNGLPVVYEIVCDESSATNGQFPQRDPSLASHASNQISTLEIVNAHIAHLPDAQFVSLEIDLLDLSKNKLTSLGAHVFKGIGKLEQLDLATNQLEFMHADTFKPLAYSLIQLNLDKNRLSARQDYADELSSSLSKLKNLTVLTLVHNELSKLPNLARMTSLRDLSFASNFISSLVDEQTGEPLLPSSLIELNLNENRLTHLTDQMFANLKNLKYLSLESNQISSISDYAFASSLMLSSINLCKNYLSQIPGRAFYALANLQRLDLSSQNQILRQIDNYAFDRKSNALAIRRIDLSNNRIARIDERAFCSKNKSNPYINVKEIDLAANPLANLNACLSRQLANGYKDPNQAAARPKISFKANQVNQLVTDNLKCDCEITKSASLVDLDGECKNEDGNQVPLKQYKCSTGDESSLLSETTLEQVCSASGFSCMHQARESNEAKSYSTESTETPTETSFTPNRISNRINNNNNNNNNIQTDQVKSKNSQATKLPASAIVSKSSRIQINSFIVVVVSLLVVCFNLPIKKSSFSLI